MLGPVKHENEGGSGGVPPDPATATDLAQYVARLDELRAVAGWPDAPIGFKKLDDMARANPAVGHGMLSKATAHRLLTGRNDLALSRDPHRFVRAYVTTLGMDPAPWLAALDVLLAQTQLPAAPVPPAVAAPKQRRRWPLVTAAVAGLAVIALVTWLVVRPEPPVEHIDLAKPSVIEVSGTGLRLAIDRATDSPGAGAVVLNGGSAPGAVWEFTTPYRDNPEFVQIRPQGKLLMCLEVVSGRHDDRAPAQQWGCNGERHQYWQVQPHAPGAAQIANLNSGLCLSMAGASAHAGMNLAQRPCEKGKRTQLWKVSAAPAPMTTTSAGTARVSQGGVVGTDAAEYPGGGKDRPCDDGRAVVDVAAVAWEGPRVFIRDSDAVRGQVSIGPGTVGAAQLFRDSRITADGGREDFYWAEGYVKFSPERFTVALQWTDSRVEGRWHTCSKPFLREHERPVTAAVIRDNDGDGKEDTWFRACLIYLPERSTTPVAACTSRY
ncbi:hypothetical protein GCM10022247_38390 [Allokutzneria multivorans]|uniref:Ricin B lectin domain-containing protein n=1 Tax=Allokutzneria multivorans TaxID=1142134 RepID=A0ABP7SIK2_9PSEU